MRKRCGQIFEIERLEDACFDFALWRQRGSLAWSVSSSKTKKINSYLSCEISVSCWVVSHSRHCGLMPLPLELLQNTYLSDVFVNTVIHHLPFRNLSQFRLMTQFALPAGTHANKTYALWVWEGYGRIIDLCLWKYTWIHFCEPIHFCANIISSRVLWRRSHWFSLIAVLRAVQGYLELHIDDFDYRTPPLCSTGGFSLGHFNPSAPSAVGTQQRKSGWRVMREVLRSQAGVVGIGQWALVFDLLLRNRSANRGVWG